MVHDAADQRGVDPCFVENHVKGHGGDGPELRGADTFNLAYQGGIVVLSADEHFSFLADGHDLGPGEDEGIGRQSRRFF
jgi:hypothetical protein